MDEFYKIQKNILIKAILKKICNYQIYFFDLLYKDVAIREYKNLKKRSNILSHFF